MKKAITLILLLSLIAGSLFLVGCGDDDDDDNNDDSTNEKFFPLDDGNRWDFEIKYINSISSEIDSVDTMYQLITGDSLYQGDGHTYKKVIDLPDTLVDLYRTDDNYLWTVKWNGPPVNQELKFKSVKLYPEVGDTWQTATTISVFEVTINGECRAIETLELPAGTFDNCYHMFISTESSLLTDSLHIWVVPELGPVKYQSYVYPSEDTVQFKIRELIDYTVAE
ncbi:MAG: hypothetical protein ACLFSQ_02100 [Candidatus Zixiibacteriota bacterium]